MPPKVLLATALILIVLAHRTVAVTCYSHNQVSAADSKYANETAGLLVACNAAANSTCCYSYESCAPDLLCHSQDGSVTRQYCTDPTWETNQCSRLCPENNEAGTVLTECDDGSYCCGVQNTECCDQGGGTRINKSNGQIVISGQISRSIAPTTSSLATVATPSPRSSATTSLVTAGGDTTSPSLPSANAGSSSDNNLSGGAKAGIAIGAVAGVALVAGLLFLLYRERRKRRALQGGGVQGDMQQGWMPGAKYPWQTVPGAPVEQKPPQEMDVNYHLRGEMDGQGRPQELPGASSRL